MTDKAIPHPWRLSEQDARVILVGSDLDTIRIALIRGSDSVTDKQDEKHAALVVKAVNHFDEVVAALEPFAMAASSWESFDCQHDYLDSDSANNITVGDLRRARKALAAVKKG